MTEENAVTALVVGLGNPGPEYAQTRHNVGQMVADEIASRYSASFSSVKRTHSQAASIRLGGVGPGGAAVVVAKPMSYMNLSGGPVGALAKYYDIAPADVVVIHDELDIPYGAIRIKRGGGSGGHNGLKDITKALGTPDYVRVRVGIGRPPGRQAPADFVLKPFSAAERKERDLVVALAADAVEDLLTKGISEAQQRFHTSD
ncbi:aminoacyl-tRNA hydrolase [Demequina sp. TTPB684]|uniref:aminoacyl-tRNA hydrolase n=1 Tax=unclassified Demequina TaxID=2620311 RepID=UPI001CF51ED8|nr:MULTISPECIES: aminoacyl-tRNA hydrolase [unclassified Demequina]MCB2411887.1 aminoacyl-tRNA hydrolase [Demequina sp. TTPB684]UPU89727.1 aminoacyl-tRNA hydrolase [Demequina sp. TMPB413]